ncbi:MAG: formate dehydrogenase subunit delta [Limnohabitans sp.]
MDTDNLVRMANQIGQFFSAYPDEKDAVDGIATHIRKFWEPRMRSKLFQAMDQGETGDLSIMVTKALQQHRAQLEPAPAH